jgi:hypothetical protein
VPSIRAALAASELPSVFMAFALAAMLRFLTPVGEQPRIGETPRPVFVGRLDMPIAGQSRASTAEGGRGPLTPPAPKSPHPPAAASPPAHFPPPRFEYAPSLSVDLRAGIYEFADGDGFVPLLLRPLGRQTGASAVAVESIVTQVRVRDRACGLGKAWGWG